jgi:hypothetical protein
MFILEGGLDSRASSVNQLLALHESINQFRSLNSLEVLSYWIICNLNLEIQRKRIFTTLKRGGTNYEIIIT